MADNEQQIPTALAGVQQVPTQGADTEGTAPPASAASILGGGGLETMVAGYLKHITDVQANSPLAVKNQAIQQQKAAAAATPVDTSKPAASNDGGDQPAPGSMGSKLMGALGDASHATDKPGGWLQGISNTVNARNQRLEQEKKDQILMARTQAETVAMHRNMHRQDQESTDAFQKANQHFVDTMSLNHDTEEASFADVQKRMKDKDFASNHYVREIGSEPVSNADGSQQKDQYGNPVTTPRYAIIAKATKDGQPDDHEVKPEWSADVKKFHGTDIPAGTKLTTGQFASLDTTLTADRNAANILGNNRGKPLSDDEIKTLRPYITDPTVQSAISHTPGDAYGGVQEQIANGDQHIANAQQAMATAQAQKNQPAYDWAKNQLTDAQEEQQKLKDFAAAAFTTKQVDAYEKKQDDSKDMLNKAVADPKIMEGHTPAYSAVLTKMVNDPNETTQRRQQAKDLLGIVGDIRTGEVQLEKDKAAGKKEVEVGYQGDPEAEDPQAFLKSLKPDEQAMVNLVGKGQMELGRLSYLAAKKPEMLAAVAKAYPGFDTSKIAGYKDLVKDFTSGKVATAMSSGGTAMGHLAELRSLNTPASHIPHTPSWTAYQNKADTLATELAKFYGDTTIPAIASIKDTLTSTLPGNREAAITTQAQSMGDKLESFEQQWKNGAPSDAYRPPQPNISPAAKRAFASLNPDYAAAHPEYGQYAAKPAAKTATSTTAPKSELPPGVQDDEHNRPKGTTGFKQGSDKKWYYTDVNNKPLQVMPGQ